GPFYPVMWGGDPTIGPYPFDLTKASSILDGAGLARKGAAPRFAVELLVQDNWKGSGSYENALNIFRNDFEKIGVDLKIVFLSRKELIDRLTIHDFEAAV